MLDIETLRKYLDEYGWKYNDFKGEVTKTPIVVTNFFIQDYETYVTISMKIDEPFLWVTTNKLFRFSDKDVLIKFLEFNDYCPSGRWYASKATDVEEWHVEFGFSIHKDNFAKEALFYEMDMLSYLTSDMTRYLIENAILKEEDLNKFPTLTKDSFDTT